MPTVTSEIVAKKRPNVNKSKEQRSIKYAYVTFRSMHDMNTVLREYNVTGRYRCLVNYLCCCCMRE